MLLFTRTTLRAAAIAIPALLATSIAAPASAQAGVSISFDDFHSRLAPYGTWSNNPRWGEVWHPTRVESGFRPYYNGHWEDTNEYGWLWVSDESWGDVPYHYGRWVSDPRDGWLWVPGYVWGPSWVVWRSGGGNIGWFPMPPDDNYYGDGAYRDNFDNQYGYRDWYGPSFGNDQFLSLWVFVGEDHFRDRNFRNYAVPQRDYGRFISQTRDSTNYVTINNYVVNRSIDATRLQRDTKQSFQPVPASRVIGRNAPVTQVNVGRQVEQRERQQHPIPVNINPAEQRGNLNSNPRQQNSNQTPQSAGSRGGERGPGSNGSVQPSQQTGRGTAPGQATPAGPAPQAGPAIGASPQNGRGQANLSPAEQRGRGNANSTAQQPNTNQAPQNLGSRGANRGPNSNGSAQPNPQTDRGAPVANTPRQNLNQAPQAAQERAGNPNPQAERGAAAGRATPPTPVANTAPPKADATPQGLAEGRNRAPVLQTRKVPAQNGKAIAQDSRAPPRAQGNTQAQRNSQGDTKNAGDQKAADDKKKAGDGRGQN